MSRVICKNSNKKYIMVLEQKHTHWWMELKWTFRHKSIYIRTHNYYKADRNTHWKKESIVNKSKFNKWCWSQWWVHIEQCNLSIFIAMHTPQVQVAKYFYMKPDTLYWIEQEVGNKIEHIDIGDDCLIAASVT